MGNVGFSNFDIRKKLNIPELGDAIVEIAVKGQKKLAEEILADSQKKVPVDTGTLQRSGTVQTKDNITTISYNTPYAAKQHEDTTLDHSESLRKHEQGEAKYLERPFNEKSSKLEEYIRKEVNRALKRQMNEIYKEATKKYEDNK